MPTRTPARELQYVTKYYANADKSRMAISSTAVDNETQVPIAYGKLSAEYIPSEGDTEDDPSNVQLRPYVRGFTDTSSAFDPWVQAVKDHASLHDEIIAGKTEEINTLTNSNPNPSQAVQDEIAAAEWSRQVSRQSKEEFSNRTLDIAESLQLGNAELIDRLKRYRDTLTKKSHAANWVLECQSQAFVDWANAQISIHHALTGGENTETRKNSWVKTFREQANEAQTSIDRLAETLRSWAGNEATVLSAFEAWAKVHGVRRKRKRIKKKKISTSTSSGGPSTRDDGAESEVGDIAPSESSLAPLSASASGALPPMPVWPAPPGVESWADEVIQAAEEKEG
ncbi:hypothetical protein P7C73_g4362, partial [Tremellales sp. Uapishka_1]